MSTLTDTPRKGRSLPKRIMRTVAATTLAMYALVGLGGGTAQAWPWDNAVAEVTAFIFNICGPENVPVPSDHTGFDTPFGLNVDGPSNMRGTVVPNVPNGEASSPGAMMDRMNAAYGGDPRVANPSYQRYGFSTLYWDSYGGGCMDATRYATPMTNALFSGLVQIPVAITMFAMKMALDPFMARIFAAIIQPVVGIFTTLFVPWIYIIAGFGALWAFVKHRGSLTKMIAQGAWIFGIVGTFLWLGTPGTTQSLNTTATNIVTNFGAAASANIVAAQNGSLCAGVADVGANSTTVINESIWYGVAYRTWLSGEVGEAQATLDSGTDQSGCGRVGIGDALLNGHYVADDPAGKRVLAAVQSWNSGSYSPSADEGEDGSYSTKMYQWTDTQKIDVDPNVPDAPAAKNVPFLAAIKVICNDKHEGGDSSDAAEDNLWMYGGQCNSGAVGTTPVLSNLSGNEFAHRAVITFAGALAALCVLLTICLVAGYILVQKMNFFFLLLFGPAFLTIAVFGDEKRRGFATKYGEQLAANVAKQIMGVFTILFIGSAVSNVLNPSLGIPWMARPIVVLLFFIALLMFSIPLKKILTAGVKGDSDIVRRTAQKATVGHMTKKTAEVGAKAAVAAGVAYASGGTSLLAGLGTKGGAMAAAKGVLSNPTALTAAGRAIGGEKNLLGSSLMRAGRGMRVTDQMKRSLTDNSMMNELAGDYANKHDQLGQKYARNSDGSLTAAGLAAARKDLDGSLEAKRHADALQAKASAAGLGDPSKREAASADQAKAFAAEQERLRAAGLLPATPAIPGIPGTPLTPEQLQAEVGRQAPVIAGQQQAAQERLANIGDAPAFAGVPNGVRGQVTSGDVLLDKAGMTHQDAVADPQAVIAQAFGGKVTEMNPMHPATGALAQLQFAAAGGNPEEVAAAAANASAAIAQFGVPHHVTGLTGTGAVGASFEPAHIAGVMSTVTPSMGASERAEVSVQMQQMLATMPGEHPARESVERFASVLADPTTPTVALEPRIQEAYSALAQADPSLAPSLMVASYAPGVRAFSDAPSEAPELASVGPAPASYAAPQPSHAERPAEVGYSDPSPAWTQDAPQQAAPAPAPAYDGPAHVESPGGYVEGPAPSPRQQPSFTDYSDGPSEPAFEGPRESRAVDGPAPVSADYEGDFRRDVAGEPSSYRDSGGGDTTAVAAMPSFAGDSGNAREGLTEDQVRRAVSEGTVEGLERHSGTFEAPVSREPVQGPRDLPAAVADPAPRDAEPAPRDTDGGIDMDALAAGVADRLRQDEQESPDEEVQVFRAKKRRRSSIFDSEGEGYDEDDFEDDAPPPPSRRDRRDRPKRRLFGGGS